MISGVHAIVFSRAADEVRAFFRDKVGLTNVDAGGGWLIFALPPAELAVHPAEASRHAIYLVGDDLDATVAALEAKGVRPAGPITEQAWGRLTAVALPDSSEIALCEPTHPRPGAPWQWRIPSPQTRRGAGRHWHGPRSLCRTGRGRRSVRWREVYGQEGRAGMAERPVWAMRFRPSARARRHGVAGSRPAVST